MAHKTKKTVKMKLKNIRGSFVYITNPRAAQNPGEAEKYGIQLIIRKDDPQVKAIKDAITEVAKVAFPGTKASMLKLPLRDGDEERDSSEYEGCYFINANSKNKPGVANRKGELASEDDMFEYCYSGAYFNLSVTFFDFEVNGKGIACGLNNIMLWKHGERLDGKTSAAKEFAEFADDSTDDSTDDLFM
jgi:hypothetical protein